MADEQKVITTMTGYEGTMGYTLCNLESGTVETHNIASECSSTDLIRYDTGLLEVNTHLYYKLDGSDNANNMFYLNRLNLKTLLTEPKIISVKAAETHILGVLADGRIVFWYSLNPSENGLCITK